MLKAPNRRQAIIWTNAYLIYWRIDAAPGADELIATQMNFEQRFWPLRLTGLVYILNEMKSSVVQ